MTNHHTLDARGLTCPEPVMMLHGVIRDAQSGDKITVLATDPSAERDISKFCTYLGHELVQCTRDNDAWVFELIKG